MPIPPPPPLSDVLDAVQHVMLPAAGAAAFVFASVLALGRQVAGHESDLAILLGRWAATPGAALAVLAGLAAGNWSKTPMPWTPDGSPWDELPGAVCTLLFMAGLNLRFTEVAKFARQRLAALWVESPPPSWPLRVLKVMYAGYFVYSWFWRVLLTAVIAWLALPADPGFARLPFCVLFVIVCLANWYVLDRVAESGVPAEVASLQGLIALLAGGVFLYAHSARFLDIATILGSAMVGIAVVAANSWVDTRGATPAFIALLPALLVSGRATTSSDVPAASFVLVAVAPLMLAPWLVLRVRERAGRWGRVLRLVSVLIPLVLALVLAGQRESLPWEETW